MKPVARLNKEYTDLSTKPLDGVEVVMDGDEDERLFQELRALRLQLAKAQNVPPYVIFHDTTLAALAKARPKNIDAMGRIPGVGAAKLERYGEVFVKALGG